MHDAAIVRLDETLWNILGPYSCGCGPIFMHNLIECCAINLSVMSLYASDLGSMRVVNLGRWVGVKVQVHIGVLGDFFRLHFRSQRVIRVLNTSIDGYCDRQVVDLNCDGRRRRFYHKIRSCHFVSQLGLRNVFLSFLCGLWLMWWPR